VVKWQDEWLKTLPFLVADVLQPAFLLAVRVHCDHFVDEDIADADLYDSMARDFCPPLSHRQVKYSDTVVVASESSDLWRSSALAGAPQLVTIRAERLHERGEVYFLQQLAMQAQAFRVVRLATASVRDLWASQQHELVYLGNPNPVREGGGVQADGAGARVDAADAEQPAQRHPAVHGPAVRLPAVRLRQTLLVRVRGGGTHGVFTTSLKYKT
jgi:hypothetical protein